ncbi:hypothetical protein ACFQY5_11475 [Paeniroseomonas aquatica]|uniref:hypothetical protein n=1 Tax=Paeniroseomonas aquatica TaxID=373043 RepID=UPI00362027A3
MKASHWLLALVPAAGLALGAVAQPNTMGFFVTSSGPGQGADLGGLAGADARCQSLAQAAGAGGRTWRAYLSTSGAGGVNARDRIGRGPWRNAKGEVVANSVAELHGTNALTLQTALTEKGSRSTAGGPRPIPMTSSPAPSRTAPPSPGRRTGPAATGPIPAPRARRWSGTTTARGCGTTMPRGPGTPPTRAAAAARRR